MVCEVGTALLSLVPRLLPGLSGEEPGYKASLAVRLCVGGQSETSVAIYIYLEYRWYFTFIKII